MDKQSSTKQPVQEKSQPKPTQTQPKKPFISAAQASQYLLKFDSALDKPEIAKSEQLYKSFVQLGDEVRRSIHNTKDPKEKSSLATTLKKIELSMAYIHSLHVGEEEESEVKIEDDSNWNNEMTPNQWEEETNPENIKKKMIQKIDSSKTLEELEEVSEQILEYKANCLTIVGQEPDMSSVYTAMVNKRKGIAKDAFDLPLTIDSNEKINDYALCPIPDGLPIMSKEEFQDMWKLWSQEQKEGALPWEEFKKQYAQNAGGSWYLVDKNGNPSQELAKQLHNSKEQKEVAQKIYAENCKALYQLPYPKRLLIASLKMEDANSVKHCNFICEWVKKKAMQVSSAQKKK